MFDLLNKDRKTDSGYHTQIGREWRLFGEPQKLHNPLVYSAFEFRMAIERFLFEFFYIMKKRFFSKRDERKVSSVDKLIKAIYFEVGGQKNLIKRLRFNRIVAELQIINGHYLTGRNLPSVFEIDILDKYWQKLSNYCHKQLQPEITWISMGNDWVNNGYNLLNEVENYLFKVTIENSIGWVNMDNVEIELKDALKDYLDNAIDENTLKLRLSLIKPIFEYRNMNKIL